MDHIANKKFEGIDFREEPFIIAEYEQCNFIKCNFQGIDIRRSVFIDVAFDQCDMGIIKIDKASFREVKFLSCKMMGTYFEHVNPFGLSVQFLDTNLDHASFYKSVMRKTLFRNCSLKEADFSNADLTESIFDNCDLDRAQFNNTVLIKSDFRTAYHYSMDPSLNKIKHSKHSYPSVLGLLHQFDVQIDG